MGHSSRLNNKRLVAILGVDGAGKTLQSNLLIELYKSKGVNARSVALIEKPTVRSVLDMSERLSPGHDEYPFGLDADHHAMAYNCDFFNHYVKNIVPLLDDKETELIISDRYVPCYKAFAWAVGANSKLSFTFLDEIVRVPDLQILLDLDMDAVHRRLSMRAMPVSPDETDKMLSSLIHYYQVVADYNTETLRIDADQSVDDVTNEIVRAIDGL